MEAFSLKKNKVLRGNHNFPELALSFSAKSLSGRLFSVCLYGCPIDFTEVWLCACAFMIDWCRFPAISRHATCPGHPCPASLVSHFTNYWPCARVLQTIIIDVPRLAFTSRWQVDAVLPDTHTAGNHVTSIWLRLQGNRKSLSLT